MSIHPFKPIYPLIHTPMQTFNPFKDLVQNRLLYEVNAFLIIFVFGLIGIASFFHKMNKGINSFMIAQMMDEW